MMTGQLLSHGEIDRWVRARRIGLAAYCLTLPRSNTVPPSSPHAITDEFRAIRQFLRTELALGVGETPHFVEDLPADVLALLCGLQEKLPFGRLSPELAGQLPFWKQSRERLTLPRPDLSAPMLASANYAAGYILNSKNDPALAIDLLKQLFGGHANDYTALASRSSNAIGALRRTGASVAFRLAAISELRKTLGRFEYWNAVENSLINTQFAWPIFVSPRMNYGAVSLPLAIDIKRDGERSLSVKASGPSFSHDWVESVGHAVDLVRRTLGRMYRRPGADSTRRFANSSVTIDLRYAEAMSANAPFDIVLQDRSLQALIATAVLGRLLGIEHYSAYAIIAGLGSERDPTDYKLEWPAAIPAKIRFALQSHQFDHVLLPHRKTLEINDTDAVEKLEQTIKEVRARERPACDVRYVRGLKGLFDRVFDRAWRSNRFIRCPDLNAAFSYLEQGMVLSDPERVAGCIDQLRFSSSSILDLSQHFTVADLLSALHAINYSTATTPNQVSPKISFMLIRAVGFEADERFWQVIFDEIAAPISFKKLLDCESSRAVAEQLAYVARCHSGNRGDRALRAPDLFVIVGANHLKTTESLKNPASRPFALNSIAAELSEINLERTTPRRQWIGNARFIVFDEDENYWPQSGPSPAPLNSDASIWLSALSVFRNGFTYPMASRVLAGVCSLSSESTRQALIDLQESGHLAFHHGSFWLGQRQGNLANTTMASGVEFKARAHDLAAAAMTPYAAHARSHGRTVANAMGAVSIHEAIYHFRQAYELASRGQFQEVAALASHGLQHLQRYCDLQGWTTVRELTRSRRLSSHAFDLVLSLTTHRDGQPRRTLHPSHWCTAAACAELRSTELRHGQSTRESAPEYLLKARQFFDAAVKACPLFPVEAEYNLLRTKGLLATFLMSRGAEIADQDEVTLLNNEILEHIMARGNGDTLSGDWFELAADHTIDTRVALKLYGLGFSLVPRWSNNLIKGLGLQAMTGEQSDLLNDNVRRLSADQLIEIIRSASGAYKNAIRQNAKCSDRWQAGIDEICKSVAPGLGISAEQIENILAIRDSFFKLRNRPRTRVRGRQVDPRPNPKEK